MPTKAYISKIQQMNIKIALIWCCMRMHVVSALKLTIHNQNHKTKL